MRRRGEGKNGDEGDKETGLEREMGRREEEREERAVSRS